MLADGFSPVELQVGLNKTADHADEVIDTVLFSIADFQPLVAIPEIEYGVEVVCI